MVLYTALAGCCSILPCDDRNDKENKQMRLRQILQTLVMQHITPGNEFNRRVQ